MKVLSVVIPAYNIEAFADQVLSSLLIQDVEEEVEVLLVNDGSMDNTREVAERYLPNHKNLRIINKENGGHGSVINLAIREAEGKYFKVIDGDDYVEKKGYINLISFLKETNADAVLNPYYTVDIRSGKKRLRYKKRLPHGKRVAFDNVYRQLGRIQLHALTIRTDILRKNHIRLTERCYYDDFEFTMFPVPYIDTVVYLDEPVYDYVIGQQQQSVNAKKALQNIDMLKTILQDSVSYARHFRSLSESKRKSMGLCILNFINNIYNTYIRNAFCKGVRVQFEEFKNEMDDSYSSWNERTKKKYLHIRIAAKSSFGFYSTALALAIYKAVSKW